MTSTILVYLPPNHAQSCTRRRSPLRSKWFAVLVGRHHAHKDSTYRSHFTCRIEYLSRHDGHELTVVINEDIAGMHKSKSFQIYHQQYILRSSDGRLRTYLHFKNCHMVIYKVTGNRRCMQRLRYKYTQRRRGYQTRQLTRLGKLAHASGLPTSATRRCRTSTTRCAIAFLQAEHGRSKGGLPADFFVMRMFSVCDCSWSAVGARSARANYVRIGWLCVTCCVFGVVEDK